MKRTPEKALLTCLWTTGSLFLYALILFLVYGISQCRIYQLCGVFLLMFSLINLILLLFRFDPKATQTDNPPPETTPEPSTVPELPEETPTASDEIPAVAPEKRRKKRKLPSLFRRKKEKPPKPARDPRELREKLCRIYRPIELLLLADVLLISFVLFGFFLAQPVLSETVAYWHLALIAILFVGTVVLRTTCKHTETEDPFLGMILRNVQTFSALTGVILTVLAASLTLELLGIANLQTYVRYGLAFLFYYVGVMIALSLVIRATRQELGTKPGIVILLPFLKSDRQELSLISFLEENTGITLRSLWSIKYVRKILPFAAAGALLLFWAATGLIYVQSNQQAAVYRFGTLQEEILEPGLHITLPYPFDKTEVYDTETLNKMTVGYKSEENSDNVWTEAQENEFKLLLGSGNELVSINLRVEYRISDLYKYLKNSASPVQILEAKAYELVTDRTISADLETILAADRESIALQMRDQLIAEMAGLDTGVEVVNVILESIHPPVDVAEVYQAFIGAEIDAEEMILVAQAASAVRIAEAEASGHEIVNNAYIDYLSRLATAKKEISEFSAAVNASAEYPSEYTYYRYLKAISSAYQNSKLIILGEGVDGSRLYYGNFATEQ